MQFACSLTMNSTAPAQGRSFCGHHKIPNLASVGQAAGDAVSPGLLGLASRLGRFDRFADLWSKLAEPLQGSNPHLPTTEMSKGQSLQSGRTSVSVDANGNLSASTAPAQPQAQPERPDLGSFLTGFLAGFLSALGHGQEGCEPSCRSERSCGEGQAPTPGGGQPGPAGLRVEGGHIILPNGKKVPFGNTGAIIQMPDGTKVGVGRNSETDSQHVRWVTAGPGENIPTNPPGKTNLFTLDAEGNLSQSGVQ